MDLQDATITANSRFQNEYYRVDLNCDRVPALVSPGQFVHVDIPGLEHRLLRRPFSVFDVDPDRGRLSIVYKIVGEGTRRLTECPTGTVLSVLGPLGHGFILPAEHQLPMIVAGGYGAAATYLLARFSPRPGVVLLGASTADELLLTDPFAQLGFEVQTATDDGSSGHQGVVTELLQQRLAGMQTAAGDTPAIYACGPGAMAHAVCRVVDEYGLDAQVSLDEKMCCGVGACLACVVRITDADAPEGWTYKRTCRDGPVFKASEIVELDDTV